MSKLLREHQIARVCLGIVLIICGLQLRRFDQYALSLADGSCKQSNGAGFECQATSFAFVTLGLGGFWALLLVGGIYYAYVYDWIVPPLKETVRSVVADVVEAVPIVLDHIRHHRLEIADLKALLLAIFENASRRTDPDGKRLGQFISDSVLYKRDGLLWRRRHFTNIVVEDVKDSVLAARFLRWKEDNTYELVSSREGAHFQLTVFGNIPCALADAATILAHMRYEVRVGDTTHHFLDGGDTKFRAPAYDLAAGWQEGCFSVIHAQDQLRITFVCTVALASRETSVSIVERSLILKSDQDFTKFNTEVMRGVKLNFALPSGYKFVSSACCLTAYEKPDAVGRLESIRFEDDDQTASLESDSWMLPGVAFTLSWKPHPIPPI